MAELMRDIDPDLVRARLAEVRAVVGEDVEVLVATKYVPLEEMPALAEAGVTLVGENTLDSLRRKREVHGDAFGWDFIGALQSRKVKGILPLVDRIHSLASDSALAKLEHANEGTKLLVQVNVAGEEGKGGVRPEELTEFLERCPPGVEGLMTMPPFAEDAESSRPHFARLAELAATHGLRSLSMGTSQDWKVAVQEGATIVRLGSSLLRNNV